MAKKCKKGGSLCFVLRTFHFDFKAERNGVRKTCYFPGRSSISWEDRIEKQEYNPTSLALNKWKTKETYSGEWKDNKRHGIFLMG